MRNRLTAPGAVLMALLVAMPSGYAATRAFKGATLIDGNGGAPIANAVLVIEGDRITAVGAAGKVAIPGKAEVIDVSGKFIIPGIMDANVHLLPCPACNSVEFLARYESSFDAIIEEAAQLALKNGVTTVFDSYGPLMPLMRVRDRINRGEIPGARMFVAGDIVGFRAVFGREAMAAASERFQKRINAMWEHNVGPELVKMQPQEIYQEIRKYIALGPDFIKYGATGDGDLVNSSEGEADVLRFSPDQQAAIVRAARDSGRISQAHQGLAASMHTVVVAGNGMTQHCTYAGALWPETIALMKKRNFHCGTQWGPLSQEDAGKIAAYWKSGDEQLIPERLRGDVQLIREHIPLLVSTDAGTLDPDASPNWGGLGDTVAPIGAAEYLNMSGIQQRGLDAMGVLQAATRNIAEAYQVADRLGTLTPGKIADLVILDADPRVDLRDIPKTIVRVVKAGQDIDRNALPTHPILTSEEALHPGEQRMK